MQSSTSALRDRSGDAADHENHPERDVRETFRARRTATATLVGLLTVTLAGAAHAVSGSSLPSPALLAAIAALSVLAAVVVAQFPLPSWGLLLILGAAQQILHLLLGGLGGVSTSLTGLSGHHPDGSAVAVSADAPSEGGAHSPEVMVMLHAHLAAALLIGWAITRHRDVLAWVRGRGGEGGPTSG